MKYDKGDCLIIRTDLKVGKEYGGCEFMEEMKRYPKIVVESIGGSLSGIDKFYYAGGFAWSEEMILAPVITCGGYGIGQNEYADSGNAVAMNSVTLLSAVTSYAIVTDFSADEAKIMQSFTKMLMDRIDAERKELESNLRN